ncbi:MAG: DUF3187 family protein [Pseudomonadales bacterium]
MRTAVPGAALTLLAAFLLAAAGPARALEDDAAAADRSAYVAPLRVRNTFPVAQLYGLPRALGAELIEAGSEWTLTLDHASNFTSDFSSGNAAFFDGETSVFSLAWRRPLREAFEIGVELPYVVHSGGFLDGVIEGFHGLTGLPNGGRQRAPSGRIDYLVRLRGRNLVDFQDSRRELGDLRAWLGYQLREGERDALALRVQLKAPTGDVQNLSGSGGTDLSIALEYARRDLLADVPLSLSLMGGAVRLGDSDLPGWAQEGAALFGHVGLQYRLGPRLALLAQLDGHGDLLDTAVPQVAEWALQGTLGGRWWFSPKLWLELGVAEDLRSQTSSDVVFQLALGVRGR